MGSGGVATYLPLRLRKLRLFTFLVNRDTYSLNLFPTVGNPSSSLINPLIFTPNKATMTDNGIWTADELMHGKDGVSSPTKEAPASPTNGSKLSLRKLKSSKSGKSVDPMDWGMPGHLTEEEVAVFVS